MIHARRDYNRIQDPALDDPTLLQGGSAIAQDEPVFLLRAQDKLMVPMLAHYIEILTADPNYDLNTAVAVGLHMLNVQVWQRENGCKAPDMSDMPLPKKETD